MLKNSIWILLFVFAAGFNAIPYAKQAEDDNKTTDLMLAIRDSHYDRIDHLLQQNADVNAQDIHGWSPLMYAIFRKEPSIVEKLLRCNANVNMQDQDGITPLLAVIDNESILGNTAANVNDFANDFAMMLLSKGADPNQADKAGHTPLMYAVHRRLHQIMDELLKKGADPNRADIDGNTALLIAVNSNNKEITDKLLKAGANPNQADKYGHTAMYYAVNPDSRFTEWAPPAGVFNSCREPGHRSDNSPAQVAKTQPLLDRITAVMTQTLKDAGAVEAIINPDLRNQRPANWRPRTTGLSNLYPRLSRALGFGFDGTFILRVLAGSDGKAKDVQIMEGFPSGDNKLLKKEALGALQFEPGIKNGQAADCWTIVSATIRH